MDQVIAQSIEWLQEFGGDVETVVRMEMDEVSYEIDDFPWTDEDVQEMVVAVEKAIA